MMSSHIPKPVAGSRVVSRLDCSAGDLPIESGILSLLKHTCRESDWLSCWLLRDWQVLYQRWISRNIHLIRLHQVQISLTTPALKPRGSPKQGYQWPHKKDTCPHHLVIHFQILPDIWIDQYSVTRRARRFTESCTKISVKLKYLSLHNQFWVIGIFSAQTTKD